MHPETLAEVRTTCWFHGEPDCPRCDPDTWLEDLEVLDRRFEQEGRDLRCAPIGEQARVAWFGASSRRTTDIDPNGEWT